MGFGYLLVLLFVAYAALKFYKTQVAIEKDLKNRGSLQPGVSYYCNLSVTHRPQQIQAFMVTNPCQAAEVGFAPAFGPEENMPSCDSFCVVTGFQVVNTMKPAQRFNAPAASPSPNTVSNPANLG